VPSIPPEIIKASIKAGSVYYFKTDYLKSEKRHFFIVLNANPKTDEVIILTCASSKIQNTKLIRKYCAPETLVIITPEQYDGFSVQSIVDCNSIIPESLSNIARKYELNELKVKPEMDIRLVRKIRRGILASNQVPPRFKAILKAELPNH